MRSIVRSIVRLAAAIAIASHFGSAVAAAQSSADLDVQKYTFSDPAAANADVTYFIWVFNNGPDAAQNVVLTDALPAGVTFKSANVFYPEGGSCTLDASSQTLGCNFGTLPAYEGDYVEVVVRAPSVAGAIVNTATVASSTPDPDSANNTSSVSTQVVVFNLSDLAVTMKASANSVLVHRAVTFTTTVTNLGPQNAAGVQLSFNPPFLADIISMKPSQGTCAPAAYTIDCLLGPLAAGAGATVTLEVKPQKDGFALTSAFASGYGDPSFFDPNDLNNFAHVAVDVNYPGNADPAFTTTTSQNIPYATFVYNPCSGEYIALSGTAHQVVSLTFSRQHTSGNTFTNYQGLTGVGLDSGTIYRATGVSRIGTGLSLVFTGWFPQEFSMLDNVRLAGGGATLLLHQNLHLTVNANGTYTSVVDNLVLECK